MRTLEVSDSEYEALERFRKQFGVTRRGAVKAAVARLEAVSQADAKIRKQRSPAARAMSPAQADELALSELMAYRRRKT